MFHSKYYLQPENKKKMKKLLYTIVFAICGISFQGCDLDTSPTNAVDSSIVFENAENAEKVLNGTWAYVMETSSTQANPGWATLFRVNDAMGNDVAIITAKYGFGGQYAFTEMIKTNSGTVGLLWRTAYKAIDNANHLITKIDDVPGEDALKQRIKAQAYGLRGYMYLYLATFYADSYAKDPKAPCAPIYTEPTGAQTQGAPRSSLETVYKRAEDDLTEAYKLIGNYSRNMKHKIDKNVIAGLLARLYLQTQSWENAAKYAAEAQTGYSWMSHEDYLAGFNDNSNAEWIWGHGQTTDQDNASLNFAYIDVSLSSPGYYSFMADPYFMDLFDEDDIRYQLFEWDLTERYRGGLMYNKFRFRSNETGDIVLMRKAEMILIEAEALAEQSGKLNDAKNKLNELRKERYTVQASIPNISGLSKEDFIEEVLIERRKELFGEGFGLADIKRRQKAVERKKIADNDFIIINGVSTGTKKKGHDKTNFPDGTPFVANSPYYIFAIPETETTNNPNL